MEIIWSYLLHHYIYRVSMKQLAMVTRALMSLAAKCKVKVVKLNLSFSPTQAEIEPCQTPPGCQSPLLTVLPDGLGLLLPDQLSKPCKNEHLIAEKKFSFMCIQYFLSDVNWISQLSSRIQKSHLCPWHLGFPHMIAELLKVLSANPPSHSHDSWAHIQRQLVTTLGSNQNGFNGANTPEQIEPTGCTFPAASLPPETHAQRRDTQNIAYGN